MNSKSLIDDQALPVLFRGKQVLEKQDRNPTFMSGIDQLAQLSVSASENTGDDLNPYLTKPNLK